MLVRPHLFSFSPPGTLILKSPVYDRLAMRVYSSTSLNVSGSNRSATLKAEVRLTCCATLTRGSATSMATGLCIRPETYNVSQSSKSAQRVSMSMIPYLTISSLMLTYGWYQSPAP